MAGASGPLAFVVRHRVSVASWTALAVIAGVLALYSVNSLVYPVHRAELNDGGVWVTSKDFGLLGRENKPVGQADAILCADTSSQTCANNEGLDVFQNQSAVVKQVGDTLTPIDVSNAVPAQGAGATVFNSAQVFMGGTAMGAVDPKTGNGWVGQVDPLSGDANIGGLDQNSKPVVSKLGGHAAGTASVNGTVFVASGDSGKLAIVTAGSTKPNLGSLSMQPSGPIVGMTAVGETPVVLDSQGNLIYPGGHVAVGTPNVFLQQPSGESDRVIYADRNGLNSVSLEDGSKRQIVAGGAVASGVEASRPIVVNGCAFGVWSDGTVESDCGSADQHVMHITKDLPDEPTFVFRVNRSEIVLNDVKSGQLWSVAPGAISPLQSLQEANKKKQPDTNQNSNEKQSKPPKLQPIDLGARNNDATTVLHVLDEAAAAPGAILAIVGLKSTGDSSYSVQIGPDRQTLLVTVHPSASGVKNINFTVDDGLGNGKESQTEGTVNLSIKSSGQSPPPTPRFGYNSAADQWNVALGNSIDIPVTANWRNKPFGDPVVLKSVKVESGKGYAQALPNGSIHYVAPAEGASSNVALSYVMSSGGADAAAQTIPVQVVGGSTPVAPQPEPDAVAGIVGAPITVHPLANDRPGADPGDPYAPMRLVSPGGHSGLNVSMDPTAGTITIKANKPCYSCTLNYVVAQGRAPQQSGQIRVDVTADSTTGTAPVTVPASVVVRDGSPALVDVLANDYDPNGGVLVVQDAAPARTLVPSTLNVSVVNGRWIRVSSPTRMSPSTQVVTYDVSNGSQSSVGTVTVTQLPSDGDSKTPVVQPMRTTVRAGFAVNIPVLDNASTPSGDPVAIAPTSNGTLTVDGNEANKGTAYVVGNLVRYVPPATVTTPTPVQVLVPIINANDPTASATTLPVTIIINPPGPKGDNPPTALPITGRVVQGGVVTLQLPSFGADPDGDPVSITSVTTAPSLGRILAVGANSITYQALPSSTGTDNFTYTVTDPYGLSDTSGTVQVGIAPPGVPQAPVAQDMTVQAAPGRSLTIDVLGHVIRPANSKVWLASVGEGASMSDPNGAVEMKAPPAGNPVVVSVSVTNGVATSSMTLTVKGVKGFENAPQVNDIVAPVNAGQKTVTVDVLSRVYDLDDSPSDIKIKSVGPGATIEGGSIKAPVMEKPQVINFVVADKHGASTSASLYVAGTPTAPYLKPGASLKVDPHGSVSSSLSDLVVVPSGKPAYLTTTSTFGSAPKENLTLTASGRQGIKVDAPTSWTGPGTVSFEVSDASGAGGKTAIITVPVQVGAATTAITCPNGAVPLYQGGDSITVSIAAVCNVWTANPADASKLKFSTDWATKVSGVSKSDSASGFTLTAAADATPNATGSVTVKSGASNTSTIRFEVRLLPPPIVTLGTLTCIKGKPCAKQDLTRGGVQSYLPKNKRKIVITDVRDPSGAVPSKADISWTGGVLEFHPSKFIPPTIYLVTVNDAGGKSPETHSSTGQILLAGIDVPVAPQGVVSVPTTFNQLVQLSWNPSVSNGSAVDQYEVDYTGGAGSGTQLCGAGTSCTVRLTNSENPYFFTVKAHNVAGWSTPSTDNVSGYANLKPALVQTLQVLQAMEGQVKIGWSPPPANGSAGQPQYHVVWSGGENWNASPPFAVNNLTDGVPTGVEISAWVPDGHGGRLEGAASSITVNAAGVPDAPSAPRFKMTSQAGSNAAKVVIGWDQTPNAKGKAPVKYQVTRTGGTSGSKTVCPWTTDQSCTDPDSLETNGTTYSYTVVAANGAAWDTMPGTSAAQVMAEHTSAPSPKGDLQAVNTPDPVNANAPTNVGDHTATVPFTVGNSHGAKNLVTCKINGNANCEGAWPRSYPQSGGSDQVVLHGLTNGTQYAVSFFSCNGSTNGSNVTTTSTNCGPVGTTQAVVPFGPIQQPTISAGVGGTNTSWTASVDPNGRPVNITVTGSAGGSWSYSNINAPWSGSGGRDLGYSTTTAYTITVTDASGSGRAPKSQTSNSVRTVDPPRPTVGISHGSATPASTCPPTAANNYQVCYRIHVDLANFSGRVTCTPSSDDSTYTGAWYSYNTDMNGNPLYNGSWDLAPYMSNFHHYHITVSCTDGTHAATSPRVQW